MVVEIQAKTSPIPEGKKFRQLFSPPLYHHFQLQSERRGGSVLDQFDALNPPVSSVLLYNRWLLRYKQKHLQFPRVKNSASFFHPPCITTFNYNQKGVEGRF